MITKKTKAFIITIIAVIGVISGNIIAYAYTYSEQIINQAITYLYGFYPIPTYVYCASDFSSETLTDIHNSCLAWNNAGAGNLVYRSTTPHTTTTHPLQNNKNEITKKNRGVTGWLMETYSVQHDEGYTLYEAYQQFNTYYPFGTASTSYHTRTIVTHEIGHLLGLGHIEYDAESVMYSERGAGEICYELNELDIGTLTRIYGTN